MISQADEFGLCVAGYDPYRDSAGFHYDPEAAERPILFIEKYCTHGNGELSGKPLLLPDWQKRITRNLYGWLSDATGARRYTDALTAVPRKNSKSTWASGLCFYETKSEPGAECYSIAADRNQSGIIQRMMVTMIRQNEDLAKHFKPHKTTKAIEYKEGVGIYRALAAEAGPVHGLNPSFCIADEIHAMPDRELIDAIKTGMGARKSPLMLAISTADWNRPESPFNIMLRHAIAVRDGVIKDPNFFPAIYRAEKSTDTNYYGLESTWRLANPNYGVSVRPDFMKQQWAKALAQPSFFNEFLRLHLNVTTDTDNAWLQLDRFDSNVQDFDLDSLKGQICYMGLDLSATTDMTALCLWFPQSKSIVVKYWVPGDTAREREKRDRVPYAQWIREGQVVQTDGDAVDYTVVRAEIVRLAKLFKVKMIGFDDWNAQLISQQLLNEDKLPLLKVPQRTSAFNSPAKYFEIGLLKKEFKIQRNPVLRWNASNVVVWPDSNGNIAPHKAKSIEKIDGICAMLNAMAVAGLNAGASVYETRGFRVL